MSNKCTCAAGTIIVEKDGKNSGTYLAPCMSCRRFETDYDVVHAAHEIMGVLDLLNGATIADKFDALKQIISRDGMRANGLEQILVDINTKLTKATDELIKISCLDPERAAGHDMVRVLRFIREDAARVLKELGVGNRELETFLNRNLG